MLSMDINRFLANLRTWRRNQKKLKRLRQSEVVLLRYPKSGVTWLRVMITNVYRSRYGEMKPGIVGRSAFHAGQQAIPNLFVCLDNFGVARPDLEARLADKKVILLLRDPRDVAISHYFSFAKRASKIERTAYNVPDTVEAEGPYEFVINSVYGMPRIIDFMNYWFDAIGRHPSALIVRYEDLRRDTPAAFTPAMKLLLPDVSPEEIQNAVASADFSRMKQMEAEGSFGLDILKPGIKTDSDSFKVRRGEVGGYADYLSSEQKAAVDRIVKETLNSKIGYD